MNEWFTIEVIDETTFAISEYGHFEKMHSYLLLGRDYALLIDSGLGIGNIKNEIDKITSLPVKLATTHVHWDHIGGHGLFDYIMVHKDDSAWLINGLPISDAAVRNNFKESAFTKNMPERFCADNYFVFRGIPSRILNDGDIIDMGGRVIKTVHTPGHSPGHCCFYEEERGYVFSGDLVYSGTLYAFYPSTDPPLFKKSVEKISSLHGIKKILPAHNSLDISNDIVLRITGAFNAIENKGLLKHGGGIFDFGDFKIHV